MKKRRKKQVSAAEQEVLDGLKVRLVRREEQARFDELIDEHHYLGYAPLVGERLCYVAEYGGEWLALLSWSAAARRLKGRDEWIGWSEEQRHRRLTLVANNSRFLILPDHHYANLASRTMKLCLDCLSNDWQGRYKHPILVVESFVDGQLFRGTAYKVSGWTQLGQTEGFGRCRQDYYVKHGRPKQLWVRSLNKGARKLLKVDCLPPELAAIDERAVPLCRFKAKELRSMMAYFRQVSDWRRYFNRYPCESLLTVVLCATLCGVSRGQRDLAAFARRLTKNQRRALRFRRDRKTGEYPSPSEGTFFRVLSNTDPHELERVLQQCQEHVLGPKTEADRLAAFDGKTLRSANGLELVSGYAVATGRWLGTEAVESKSNEIPAAQRLLARMDLEGHTAVLDALHTQDDTARQIVQDCGGDYLLTVKDNQKGINETVQQLWRSRRGAFSPSGADDGATGRDESRTSGSTGSGKLPRQC